MDKALTTRQNKVYKYLCNFIFTHGYGPSYKDIANEFNFSSDGTVRTYLEHLEKKGYIIRHGKARSIQIINNPKENISILGKIKAGNPMDAYEEIIGTVSDIECLKHKRNRFALTVKGDSMLNAGIHDQDIVIIEKKESYKTGHIVAILIDNQATLKKIIFNKDHIIAMPENNAYSPIKLSKTDQNKILGKMIGLIRTA